METPMVFVDFGCNNSVRNNKDEEISLVAIMEWKEKIIL